MLFRKKKQVDINGNPLESVTVGQIKQSRFTFLKLILMFTLFGGIIYFLPELSKLYQLYFGTSTSTSVDNTSKNNTTTNNTINNTVRKPVENEDSIKKYLFTEDNNVLIEDYQFTNISYENNIVSFTVKNASKSSANLKDKNIYFILYYGKNIVRYLPVDYVIEADKEHAFTFDVDSNIDSYSIEEVLEKDYPVVKLTNNTLTCDKGQETVVYTFDSLKKLISINHNLTYPITNADYDDKYSSYKNVSFLYSTYDGVTSNIYGSEDGFTYKMLIDYEVYNGTIDNLLYFAKNTSADKISFILGTELYNCK